MSSTAAPALAANIMLVTLMLFGALVPPPSTTELPWANRLTRGIARPAATALSATLLAHPALVHAASVTMDFGYRIERALDPDKRGPAEEDYDLGGMSALDAMCNPVAPSLPEASETAAAAAAATAKAAGEAASPKVAAAAAAAAAAATTTPEPASSAMPPSILLGSDISASDGLDQLLHSAPVLAGVPLLFATVAFLQQQMRPGPSTMAPAEPGAISVDSYELYAKMWSARSSLAPGYTVVDLDGEEDMAEEDEEEDDEMVGRGGGGVSQRLEVPDECAENEASERAGMAAAAAALAAVENELERANESCGSRRTELQRQLDEAVARQDFASAAALKKDLDDL